MQATGAVSESAEDEDEDAKERKRYEEILATGEIPDLIAACKDLFGKRQIAAIGVLGSGPATVGAKAADVSLSTGSAEGHEDRSSLLTQKKSLGSQMEELRATMRSVQEDGEVCTNELREFEIAQALDEVLIAAKRDELATLKEQLKRARQQGAEHAAVEQELRNELERASATYEDLVTGEAETQRAVRQEIAQLQQVVQDLRARMDAKGFEMEHLENVNVRAAARVAFATKKWQDARSNRLAALQAAGNPAVSSVQQDTDAADDAGKVLPLLGICLGMVKQLEAKDYKAKAAKAAGGNMSACSTGTTAGGNSTNITPDSNNHSNSTIITKHSNNKSNIG
eukprot:TRINITY_DN81364_c0_g1_i1.p1 TRINITY_DN81364_c0_g1~~TRINITY_DN81364_c0_g1_i1.p1  ORF type:complete len:340 (-),score=101.41 TRINITY_DN81364_c0_g1_i1:271-1290(-)